MTARRAVLHALVATAAALSIAVDANATAGLTGLSATVDRTRISTELGRAFVFRSAIANQGSTPATGLIAHLNIVSLSGGVYVDPEDWSTRRTRYLGPLASGGSRTITWRLKAVNAGSFGVYVAVLDPAGGSRPPTIGPLVAVTVAGRTTLNAGGILPVAIGVPAILGMLTVGLAIRRRRSP